MAVNAVNCILLVQTEPLNNIMDVFLSQLFGLANDEDTVRTVCYWLEERIN